LDRIQSSFILDFQAIRSGRLSTIRYPLRLDVVGYQEDCDTWSERSIYRTSGIRRGGLIGDQRITVQRVVWKLLAHLEFLSWTQHCLCNPAQSRRLGGHEDLGLTRYSKRFRAYRRSDRLRLSRSYTLLDCTIDYDNLGASDVPTAPSICAKTCSATSITNSTT
jgi:hypothetical protein